MTTPCLILTALATSGLRPNYDQPLELGLLAVDRETFEPVDMFVETLCADPTSLFSDADEKVVEMHTANGLFEVLVAAMPARFSSFDHAARAVELKAVEFIEANRATGECRSPLICFGTDWTHRWLSSRFPKLVPNFRGDLDMSTVLNMLGQQRKRGDGRVESTLTELYSVVKQIAPRE